MYRARVHAQIRTLRLRPDPRGAAAFVVAIETRTPVDERPMYRLVLGRRTDGDLPLSDVVTGELGFYDQRLAEIATFLGVAPRSGAPI
jgi:hypothetical protein